MRSCVRLLPWSSSLALWGGLCGQTGACGCFPWPGCLWVWCMCCFPWRGRLWACCMMCFFLPCWFRHCSIVCFSRRECLDAFCMEWWCSWHGACFARFPLSYLLELHLSLFLIAPESCLPVIHSLTLICSVLRIHGFDAGLSKVLIAGMQDCMVGVVELPA